MIATTTDMAAVRWSMDNLVPDKESRYVGALSAGRLQRPSRCQELRAKVKASALPARVPRTGSSTYWRRTRSRGRGRQEPPVCEPGRNASVGSEWSRGQSHVWGSLPGLTRWEPGWRASPGHRRGRRRAYGEGGHGESDDRPDRCTWGCHEPAAPSGSTTSAPPKVQPPSEEGLT